MDVTPQLIEQIDFPEKFRGYDPDEVDDFLERCGATITDLTNRVREAAERAEHAEADARTARAALAAAPPVAAAVAPALTDDQEIEHATRTLVLAKRTADAAVAEARTEAARLVSQAGAAADAAERDARVEAERLIADARAHHEAALVSAKEDAEREYGSLRDRHREQVNGLEERKRTLTSDLERLEARVTEYLDGLRKVHTSVGALIEDPEALHVRPPLDLEPSPPVTFYDTTAEESRPDAVPSPHAAVESTPIPPAPTFSSPGFASPVSAPLLAPQPKVAPPLESDPDSLGTADPWGPGSWSAVTATGESPIAEVSPATPPQGSDHPAAAYDGPQFGSTPPIADPNARFAARPTDERTGFQPPIEPTQDRYLRQLDEAVNGPDVELDRAMSNFFEGEEGESPQFGR